MQKSIKKACTKLLWLVVPRVFQKLESCLRGYLRSFASFPIYFVSFFNDKELNFRINPDEAVAYGKIYIFED